MIRAVIFDLDGTLTEFNVNVQEVKKAIGCGDMPILEFIMTLDEEERRRAGRILREEELRAAKSCELKKGVRELLEELRRMGLKLAILTRNNREAVELVLRRFQLKFDFVYTREDGKFKPSEEAMLRVLSALGVSKDEAIFIGDHEIDRICGNLSGVRTFIIGEDIKEIGEIIKLVENENNGSLSEGRVWKRGEEENRGKT
ncbi:MAG: HAD-IA family hydrolase [Archaeoglobi archaeon]|nr:HAD-IA family hydrolase [Candidatus Mnemosynella sp.]